MTRVVFNLTCVKDMIKSIDGVFNGTKSGAMWESVWNCEDLTLKTNEVNNKNEEFGQR